MPGPAERRAPPAWELASVLLPVNLPDDCLPRALRLARRAVLIAAVVAPLTAAAFFPFAGRYLHVNEPLERADAIFVLAGARVERWLEATDLYREQWAPRIVLSPGYLEPAERHLRSMGIRYPAEAELVREGMIQLAIPSDAVSVLPEEVDNTAQEAAAIRRLCTREGWTKLIVITSIYHSRRAQLAFRQAFGDTPVTIIVRTTRYDGSTPRRWWRHRFDIRYVVTELQKLVAYRLGLAG